MVTEWGMSDRVGFVYYGEQPLAPRPFFDFGAGRDASPQVMQAIDEEVRRIIDEAYADTKRLVERNREQLDALAKALLKYETLDGEEVRRIINGEMLDKPTVADLIAVEQDRRRAESPPLARPVKHPPDEPGPVPSPA
jgi:cell division protease FtsH